MYVSKTFILTDIFSPLPHFSGVRFVLLLHFCRHGIFDFLKLQPLYGLRNALDPPSIVGGIDASVPCLTRLVS